MRRQKMETNYECRYCKRVLTEEDMEKQMKTWFGISGHEGKKYIIIPGEADIEDRPNKGLQFVLKIIIHCPECEHAGFDYTG